MFLILFYLYFKPVDYFGGKKSYIIICENDKRKKRILLGKQYSSF